MVKEECGKYIRVCDECGAEIECKYQHFVKLKKKEKHYCRSCVQSGERNHRSGKSPWNIGLTKTTDERVMGYARNGSLSKKGCVPWNKGKTYSELMGSEWAERFAKKLSDVKTGIPNLKRRKVTTKYLSSFKIFRKLIKNRLYLEWSRPILERADFLCETCGSGGTLEVHHLYPFRRILVEVSTATHFNLSKYDSYSEEQINEFISNVILAHRDVDGMALCKKCHMIIDNYRKKFDN